MSKMVLIATMVDALAKSGSDIMAGRVEVFHNEQWGTLCNDNWRDKDTSVICI